MVFRNFKFKAESITTYNSIFLFARVLFLVSCERALSEITLTFVVFNYFYKQAKNFSLLSGHVRAIRLVAEMRISVELVLIFAVVLGVLDDLLWI